MMTVRKDLALYLALGIGLLLIAPVLIYPAFLIKILCFALFAIAFDLLLGGAGLLSFGHAAFLGCGAYVSAYTIKYLNADPLLGILAGTVSAAVLGLLFGLVAIRRQGIYFAMITLALAQLFYFLCVQIPQTGGEDGIQGVPRGKALGWLDLSSNLTTYYLVLAIFLLGAYTSWRILRSPFGTVLRAIRDNETRAISLGYRTARYKLVAFVASATLAGMAGATKAMAFQVASLLDVQWQTSGEVILMALIGGIGTLLGPLVGATVVVSLESYLADLDLPITVVIGVIFIVCVSVFRAGIMGEVEKRRTARLEREQDARTTA
ncbi:branched-chain amino acid ABC transporter permease [Bordetella genomosp. 12]|uniref:Branched-chain amino acid ABC transporter permease n=1 Tax=Bordetella genomosp. 12 TaxID=463035 RepID=A0A261VWM0_9BORD|nr:branched-chain amino acid ABC transporter permease [Bordetella genomosp. 12]OZI77693.1 branched-chain amino acid ABC transporter permease [Bordetella genomosp. 12]